ncbi:hypothetical protein OJF2_52630 [Aquisphaera giovannonii]|uniref:SGNH hydrolase-type esterase domain-containing protein n=1 Tax=Aquisphaera giovannonii TaxID=406548 RepID=A0A5B9W7W9_9BACT|nr:hypothetical protein [Aquisphaera giovannonii]QEH36678.1 hypothetical protein OJF2_52630 [Aquisphaera giovannonii]
MTKQRELPFLARARRRDRGFKALIAAATLVAGCALVAGQPDARGRAREVLESWRWRASELAGMSAAEDRLLALRRVRRPIEVESARRSLERSFRGTLSPPMREFMRAAKMDAETGLLRWGNFDRTLLLSSAVLEADDSGRSYRLLPQTRSVWVIGLSLRDMLGLFLVPDNAEVRAAAARAGGTVVEGSRQWTNSWGCRGPEPDPDAPFRLLVLGDSVMEGALIGDDETPPARLGVRLGEALGERVSVLNTGHLGYSPEQYFHTLEAFGERFRPHYVVMSVTSNDFGDMNSPDNWLESEHWVDAVASLCYHRGWPLLLVPAPNEADLVGRRDLSLFTGQVTRIYRRSGREYFDPLEAFAAEKIRLRVEQLRAGTCCTSTLYNLHLQGDRHFSPAGADLWAREVAKRLQLDLAWRELSKAPAR